MEEAILLLLLLLLPILFFSGLPRTNDSVMGVTAMVGARGILFGIAVGTLLTGIRPMLATDRLHQLGMASVPLSRWRPR